MIPAAQLAALAVVTLTAAGIQSATGFGFGLLTAPIFLLVLDSADAIQVVILLTLSISLALIGKLWRVAPIRPMALLAAGSAAGFPLGIAAFVGLGLVPIKVLAAVVVIASAAQALARRLRPSESAARAPGAGAGAAPLVGVGLVSGAMATCLGMPGPPVMAYLAASGFGKDEIRATLLTLFAFSYAVALALQATMVGVQPNTWWLSALLVPVALAGTVIGHLLAPRISQRAFQILVIAVLFATGTYLLATALWY
jgi:uncharacterized membrane protein YfcA